MADLISLAAAVKAGNVKLVRELTAAAVQDGIGADVLLNEGFVVPMAEIGVLFKANEVFVPEVMVAARAMKAGMEILKPVLAAGDVQSKGKVAMGTVQGDLHDIGKNLVCMMLEGAGFEVIDLGIDTPPQAFVDAIREGAQIIGLSTLLTTTMPAMREAVEAIRASGMRDSVKIMVGGAPVTQAFADEIGADGYSTDAASAVDLANALLA